MIDHIYFLFDPLRKRIKIGVAKKLVDRIHQHQKANKRRLIVLGVMEGSNPKENELLKQFAQFHIDYSVEDTDIPKEEKGQEWFKDNPELRTYISQNTVQWDGADTFPWNGGAPTFAVFGSSEWIAWLEGFAQSLGERPGEVLDQALALLAQQKGLAAPPQRWSIASWPKNPPHASAAPLCPH